MIKRCLLLLLCAAASVGANEEAFNGRWIGKPLGENNGRVLWLEISGAGTGAIAGKMVGGPGGQLDPLRNPRIEGGQLRFELERPVGRDRKLVKTPGTVAMSEGRLLGVLLRPRGPLLWVGERAPVIADRDDGTWREGRPVPLFDGSDRSRWRTLHPGRDSDWHVEGGLLKNRRRADVLVTRQEFWNFQLEVEYRVRPGMNGGIGLRGRYEIQLLDDFGQPASDHGNGALYGRIRPSVNASRRAGEWQTLAIRLVGREVTVALNGKRTIERAVVAGFTAMATDWRESEPGPITLQGDHGAIDFRRIVLTPLTQ